MKRFVNNEGLVARGEPIPTMRPSQTFFIIINPITIAESCIVIDNSEGIGGSENEEIIGRTGVEFGCYGGECGVGTVRE